MNKIKIRKPVLVVDQDDVLAVLLDAWVEKYNEDFEDSLKPEDIKTWNIMSYVKPEVGPKIFDYLDIPDFMENLPIKDGSQKALKSLSEHFEIFVVTAPMDYSGVPSKVKWLQKYFPFIPKENYVFTMNKSIVRTDFMVDDGVHNLEGLRGGYPILFDAPHNQQETRFQRVKNWKEAYHLLMKLKEEMSL